MKADPAVLSIVENWCQRVGVESVGQLAQQKPKEFDVMTAAIDDLLEQAPTPGSGPIWME